MGHYKRVNLYVDNKTLFKNYIIEDWLACPFCLNLDLSYSEDEKEFFRIACPKCGCKGPLALNIEQAAQFWNSR